MEFYSALKETVVMIIIEKLMELENTELSQRSQTQKDKYCMFLYDNPNLYLLDMCVQDSGGQE